MPYIYCITNDVNGKQYIGKTQYDNIMKRWKEHCRDYKKSRCEKRPLYDAMNKYGIEHFHIEEIEYINPGEILEEREMYWIAQYDTYNNGYNATIGGDGKSYLNYEELIKAYERLGTLTAVHQEYGCDTHYLSQILKNYGIEIKSKKEIAAQKYTSINQYDLDGNFIQTFPNAKAAFRSLKPDNNGTGHGHIIEVCKGRRKTAYGYIWRYADKDI